MLNVVSVPFQYLLARISNNMSDELRVNFISTVLPNKLAYEKLLKLSFIPGLIEHSYNARTLQDEAGGFRVLCQSGLPNDTLNQKAKPGAVEIVQSVMTSARMKT